MNSVVALKLMIAITVGIGLIGSLAPFFSQGRGKLITMLTSSGFFLLSIAALGIFYVQNGVVSCTILSLVNFNIKFHVEPLGLIFLASLTALWCVTVYYTYYYLKIRRSKEQNYCYTLSFMTLCIVAAALVGLSANMITMFIFYELLTLFTIPLIYKGDLSKLARYLKPLLYSALLFWLPAILYINYVAGSTDFVTQGILTLPPTLGITLFLMITFGIGKAALIPFHIWLPEAMVAIHPVSAMLHSVAVVNAGLFCIFKILLYIFGFDYLNQAIGEFNWLIFIPAITILYASICALMSKELKQLLAYSTISQLALCILGAFIISKAGLAAAVMHMLSHSAAKITLFFAAGSFYLLGGKNKLEDLKGIYYIMPYTSIAFCIAALSLAGAPFLAGHISKAYLYDSAHNHQYAYWILNISTLLTCSYLIKVMWLFFMKTEISEVKIKERIGLLIPIGFSTIITMIFPVLSYVTEKLLGFL